MFLDFLYPIIQERENIDMTKIEILEKKIENLNSRLVTIEKVFMELAIADLLNETKKEVKK